ncbi:MAG: ribonuclease III [Marinilabiliales bacterium]|nr:MAG: ribonuclease III [Marinilabiliales bacterium]
MPFFFFRRLTKKDKILFKKLEEIIGFKPNSLFYYKQALRHASVISKDSERYSNNERLEFVGDAIISAIVSDILFEYYPKANEGKLSILRSTIVNRKSLNQIAKDLGITKLLEFKQSPVNNMKNLGGNSFEAIVGAIYYDRGYKYCIKFLNQIIDEYFDLKNLIKQNTDYKSKLLQYIQKHKLNLVIDTVENVEVNEKNQHFISEICIDNVYMAMGKGWSKKDAEQQASRNALRIIKSKSKSEK